MTMHHPLLAPLRAGLGAACLLVALSACGGGDGDAPPAPNADTVKQATALAKRSGDALGEIVAVVETAGDQVRAIATAAEEQSATSEEINRAVEAISRIASETAQAMGQSAQAVTELAAQAHELNTLVADIKGGSGKAALTA